MTPEQLEAERLAREAAQREYEESRRQRQELINQAFEDVRSGSITYRTVGRYDINTDMWASANSWVTAADMARPSQMDFTIRMDDSGNFFYDTPAVTQRTAPPPPSLNERLQAAIQEADRCARTGDNLGRIQAINAARNLRRELVQSTLTSTI